MALKLISPPAIEPLSLGEVKEYLRLDGYDTDLTVHSLIKAGRDYCEKFQNRVYITQTWDLVLDTFPILPLKIPISPLQSLISISYKDKDGNETTIDPNDYIVDTYSDPGRVIFSYGKTWPSVTLYPINGVKIRFKAGYGDTEEAVPESVKQAIKIYVAHRYENPETQDVPSVVDSLLWPDRAVPI